MSQQRFFRCRLCGLPHEVDTTTCPVIGRVIPPAQRSVLPSPPSTRPPPGPGTAPSPDEPVGGPSIPGPAKLPRVAAGRQAPPSLATPTIHPLVGTVIDGRYRVLGVLAEGGMGVVYDGEHVELGRAVAIKALARRFNDDAVAVQRFRNEARLSGGLGHPHIVEVFDLGSLPDGSPYLVMEKLEGESLARRLRRERRMATHDVVHILSQMLSALGATHARGIIHRDLKPDNVYLLSRAERPHVKLLDFGVSKNTIVDGDGSATLTRAGFVMGTPTYMAPEQARGKRDLDGRVDLYAAGAVAYEMLMGHPPYDARHPATLVAAMKKNPPERPMLVRSDVSPLLDGVVMTLLQLDRNARYARAEEALTALVDATAGDDDPTHRIDVKALRGVRMSDADSSQKVQVFAWDEKKKR